MTFLFGRAQRDGVAARDLLAARGRTSGAVGRVSAERARRHSVVWAAQRIRADLVSVMPIDVYKPSALGINTKAPTPPVLVEPWETAEGHPMAIGEWLYSSQSAVDAHGNAFGVIREKDAYGLPSRIELVSPDDVTLTIRGSRIKKCRVNGEKVELEDLWHERQYTVPGLPIGLSPIAHAALTLQTGLSAQEFALDWFTNGAAPSSHLRNTEQTLNAAEAARTKRRFLASQQPGGVFVSGKDWEYSALSAKAAESGFVEQADLTNADLCRFLSVPADIVDVAAAASSSITYANIVQRNLQLLVLHLGPSIKRREDALSRLAFGDRFVKLNRSALLAMDDKTRAELFKQQIDARTRTPDEVRGIDDMQPLAESDYAQFERLFGARSLPKTPTTGGN